MSSDLELRNDVGTLSVAVMRALRERAAVTEHAQIAGTSRLLSAKLDTTQVDLRRFGASPSTSRKRSDEGRISMMQLRPHLLRSSEGASRGRASAASSGVSVRLFIFALRGVRHLERRLVATHDRGVARECWRESKG